MAARRSYGTGSLHERSGSWYGRWWANGRRVQRKLGPVRAPGTRDGLTRAQAERELRRRIEGDAPAPTVVARLTVEQSGERLIRHLASLGRKRSTIEGYDSYLRVHLAPFFGQR